MEDTNLSSLSGDSSRLGYEFINKLLWDTELNSILNLLGICKRDYRQWFIKYYISSLDEFIPDESYVKMKVMEKLTRVGSTYYTNKNNK